MKCTKTNAYVLWTVILLIIASCSFGDHQPMMMEQDHDYKSPLFAVSADDNWLMVLYQTTTGRESHLEVFDANTFERHETFDEEDEDAYRSEYTYPLGWVEEACPDPREGFEGTFWTVNTVGYIDHFDKDLKVLEHIELPCISEGRHITDIDVDENGRIYLYAYFTGSKEGIICRFTPDKDDGEWHFQYEDFFGNSLPKNGNLVLNSSSGDLLAIPSYLGGGDRIEEFIIFDRNSLEPTAQPALDFNCIQIFDIEILADLAWIPCLNDEGRDHQATDLIMFDIPSGREKDRLKIEDFYGANAEGFSVQVLSTMSELWFNGHFEDDDERYELLSVNFDAGLSCSGSQAANRNP